MQHVPRRTSPRPGPLVVAALAWLTFSATAVRAHDPGLSSLDVHVSGRAISVSLSIAAADVAPGSPGREPDAERNLRERLRGAVRLSVDGAPLPLTNEVFSIENGGANVRWSVVIRHSAEQVERLTITSEVPKRLVRGHRELLTISVDNRVALQTLLDAEAVSAAVDLGAASRSAPRVASSFLMLGLRHILSGYDHLVFLAGLLLATIAAPAFASGFGEAGLASGFGEAGFGEAGLTSGFGEAGLASGFGEAGLASGFGEAGFASGFGVSGYRRLVIGLTAFTAAHSVSLTLVVIGGLRAPPSIVEPLIAVSIAWVGVDTLRLQLRVSQKSPAKADFVAGWLVVFVFGLIHGFGFSGALMELGFGSSIADVALALFSFNAGVEAGQLAAVAAMLPLVWVIKSRPNWRAKLLPLCSVLIAAAGAYWLVERLQ